MTPAALLLTAALLKGDLPLEQRLEKLAPFFKPAPGGELSFDERELRDLKQKVKAIKLRGQLVVSPPKGTCFTIQRDPAESDVVVCKQTALSFSFGELDKNGRLNWKVSTGEGDFGTSLWWRSPYRVAIVTPFDKSLDDPPTYKFIHHCDGLNDPEKGRRIILTMIDGETWVVRFPAADELLLQPDPLPNLFITQATGRVSVKDAAERKKQPSGAEAKPEGEGEKHEGEAKKEGGEHGEAPKGEASAPKPQKPPSDDEERADWSIPRRGSYTMPASNFQPFGSVAPGMKGECRYTFNGPDEDPHTGRLECHDVDGFKHVYLPLTCIGQIRHRR